MRILALAPLLFAFPTIAQAQEKPDPARLKASVEKLVGFGTRHTLSDADDPSRGIGAARRWFAAELARLGDRCGCIEVANIARGFTGPRAPNGVQIVDVLGFQAGTDPKRVVIVMGHIDSRVSDVMNATADAPGANDDASGVALVLEAARILSREKFRATIVYAALSGEEQGLFGGQLLAETAKERGWTVTAVLNNDIVGNTVGTDGRKVADRVRIFSESFGENDAAQALQGLRADGGEDDGPSRALAKAIGQVAGTVPGGLGAFLVRRPDRFGRGGDHSPFQKLGYPAVRFSVGVENYDAQHQDLAPGKGDTVDRMDFPYLAGVTALNVATIRRLAAAPAAPDKVTIGGALASDTSVKWAAVPGAAKYRVHWRRADARDWTDHLDVAGTEASLKGVIVDDNFVGVSAIGADGAESLVTFGRR
ncbi:peptidase M28 [Sphingomonas sp. IBVSS2]|uniref:M20/M25/M40 family metallo-hydrolase n=1 Tax=Sphingomonas sp. IBVSS2 TaxID=1985172 RepID=UPI000A2D0A1C|nr:M20/M25/M40 family metallo-hydrolase [Sphingomonas sp. IBVSS2]OSZ68271.1 peptidase M28 [Sphingomonas sp. IBVSS2]